MCRAPRKRATLVACALTGVVACAHPRQISHQDQTSSSVAPVVAPAGAAAGPEPVAQVPAKAAPGIPAPMPAPPAAPAERVSFAGQVQPILEARCRPCHFAGGQLYARLPFDRPATILELREKLFTRIKNEEERRTIREFLAAHPAGSPGPG